MLSAPAIIPRRATGLAVGLELGGERIETFEGFGRGFDGELEGGALHAGFQVSGEHGVVCRGPEW